jgi:hypothetical protein
MWLGYIEEFPDYRTQGEARKKLNMGPIEIRNAVGN